MISFFFFRPFCFIPPRFLYVGCKKKKQLNSYLTQRSDDWSIPFLTFSPPHYCSPRPSNVQRDHASSRHGKRAKS